MPYPGNPHRLKAAAGFTLPSILVVTAALLILAVGILLVSSVERSTARSFVDRQRAELAARAGLEEVRGILNLETANDDFLIIQSKLPAPIVTGYEPAPHLFLARGEANGTNPTFRYVPLFSRPLGATPPEETTGLKLPDLAEFVAASVTPPPTHAKFTTLPYQDRIQTAWVPVTDSKGQMVGRYAYWVEDLQSRVDPAIAGNDKGTGGTHARVAWPFPGPGLNDLTETEDEAVLNQIALFALDPAATDTAQKELGKTLFGNRKLLISPDAHLAAAGIQPPLTRLETDSADGAVGDLIDPRARAVERGLAVGIRPYLEQPLIPCASGIDPAVFGKPKLNLNKLLAEKRTSAVDEMAAFIKQALPNFEDRKGGFPEDYVKTLAANALDYADEDKMPTLLAGVYRGIDSYPLTTEIVLKVNYQGMPELDGRQVLKFTISLFAELYNPTDAEVSGSARLSYEVGLKVSPLGTGIVSPAFDSPDLLEQSVPPPLPLDKIAGTYWTKPQTVSLQPNEYKCYKFAEVNYEMDQGTVAQNPIGPGTPFSLLENKAERGSSLMWNDVVVERQQGVVRHQGFVYGETNGRKTGGYLVGDPDILSKAHLPALVYNKPSSNNSFYGNTGDPRISHYLNRLNDAPLDDSAYPENASPNRRSVRRDVYRDDVPTKPKVYARMLPSEWPDGGHNSPVGTWFPGESDATEITNPKFNFTYDPDFKHYAIQRISNRGYFFSTTELGHIFDPIMFAPVFKDTSETDFFWANHIFPSGVDTWPDVKTAAPNVRNPLYGGGNTLRIGRPEHPAFSGLDGNYNRATALLDLFHTGQPSASDPSLKTGQLIKIHGHVNINTASRDALRTIAAGLLVMDPKLSKRTNASHLPAPIAAPPTEDLKLDAPKQTLLADKIADAVIAGRPYASPSGMALATDFEGKEVFGNRKQYPEADNVRWTDSAAEEVFARVYQASTVRSRNFRVWIVAQALNPVELTGGSGQVLSEVRKVHTVFVDPGMRLPSGGFDAGKNKTTILSTNEF